MNAFGGVELEELRVGRVFVNVSLLRKAYTLRFYVKLIMKVIDRKSPCTEAASMHDRSDSQQHLGTSGSSQFRIFALD